ncbi:MAG: cobalamin-dependent protein [Desulfobacteraceae bacterium]|nr:cobalamin-dependent protein [Desulfobacteraceae bacterium]
MSKEKLKKVLLVHPLGYKSEKASGDISRIANITPPLGIASICAYLGLHQIECDIIDCYAHPDADLKIIRYLKKEKPDYIGFSCSTSTFNDGLRHAQIAKSIIDDIKVVFGGAHVSALKESIIKDFKYVDYVVVGEGEQTFTELIKAENNNISDIKNIVYRNSDNEVIFTGYREELLDLDSIPFPAYEKLEGYPEKYKLPIFNYPVTPNSSCISSRGCPYSCSYCDRSVFRKTFRFNSAEYLYDHFKYLNKNFGIRHVNFYDDQFTFKKKRVLKFCELMTSGNLKMSFNCAARAEHLDFELVTAMKAAGCWMISLGVETGDENLLAQHRQNADLQMLRDKIALIKKAKIRVKALLMMGLPGETKESIAKSKKYVFSLPIDDFNLAKFTPFPGSPIYQQIKEGALIGTFDENWKKMDCMEFLFIPNGITKKTLEKLFIDFYRSHFMRHKVLFGYISMIWKSPDSWHRFFKSFFHFMSFIKNKKRHKE